MYLTKPVKHSDLLDALATLFGGSVRRDRAETPPQPASSPVKPLRILVAEDHPVNRKLVTTLLTKRGHTVESVDNGRSAVDAVALAGARPFDVVIMDVQMPTMSGFDATAANNVVTFTPAVGSAASATASAITTLSAATGLRRLTVTVPAGLPIGTAALSVRNAASGETSAGKSLEVVGITLTGVASAAVGASNVNVRITGSPNSAFAAGSTRATFGAGITVNTTTVESPTSLVANVSVSPTAALGLRAVSVVSNTQTALRAQAFAVVAAPANGPPVWTPLEGQTLNERETRALQLTATDPDGDPLTLTVAGLPRFAAFVDLGGGAATLSLNPDFGDAGVYSVIATATDSKGAATSFNLAVIVLAPRFVPEPMSASPT